MIIVVRRQSSVRNNAYSDAPNARLLCRLAEEHNAQLAQVPPIMTSALVLGIGDVRMADQGAGVRAMQYLKDHYDLPGTVYADAGTAGASLAAAIAAADNIIIFNAAEIGASPGTVRVVEKDAADLADLIDTAGLDGPLPNRLVLISVQPGELGPGDSLSEPVRRSMPKAAGNAATLVYRWQRSESVFTPELHALPNSG